MLAISIPAVDYPARADIRRLIGETQWLSLPVAVRARFAEHAASAEYAGTFDEVSASFAGKLLATCCRLLGTPVAPFTGSNVPATVNVFATTDGGTAWQRTYRFAGRKACVVESVKRLSREGTLVEALPAGMRMALDVYAGDGVLHFMHASSPRNYGKVVLDQRLSDYLYHFKSDAGILVARPLK